MSLVTTEVVSVPVPRAIDDIILNIYAITGDTVSNVHFTEFLIRQAEYFLEEGINTVDMVRLVSDIIVNTDNFSPKLRFYATTPLCLEFKDKLPLMLESFYLEIMENIIHNRYKGCANGRIEFINNSAELVNR